MEHALLAIPGQNVLFLVQYIAADLHLWESRDLDVTVQYIIGIGAMNAVISGSAEFSMSSGATIARAASRGQKLVALATAINQSGQDIVLRKEIAARQDPQPPEAPTHATLVRAKYGDQPVRQPRPNANRGDNVTGASPYQDTELQFQAEYPEL